jgi:hypothetical protein
MSSKASVKKNKLADRISDEGYRSVIPCERCVRLHKVCVRVDSSDRCGPCVGAGGKAKCVMSPPSYTDAEWRRLVKLQQEIAAERRAALAKVMRLERQESLLRERAGDFIAREYKDIAELEELERREAEELQRLADERIESELKEREAESSRAASERIDHALVEDHQVLAATSEDPTLTQLLASSDPSPNVDFDAFFASFLAASASPSGNTVEPAGGSPSGS